jgi:hypothetical protein
MKTISCLMGVLSIGALTMLAQEPSKKQDILFWPSPEQMHKGHVEEFISHPGFGYRRVMTPYEGPSRFTHEGSTNQLKRVDLIGIAEHSSPVAFISRYRVPTKADFTNALFRPKVDVRPLTAFETNAVAQLNAGNDIVVDFNQRAIVGAIRARTECIKCHEVKRGALLGALSYMIAPEVTPEPTRSTPTQRDLEQLQSEIAKTAPVSCK